MRENSLNTLTITKMDDENEDVTLDTQIPEEEVETFVGANSPVDEEETTEEEVESEAEDEVEETEPEVDVEALKTTNKKLYERTKKAEAELKALKGTKTAKTVSPQPNVEEVVLKAQGMDEKLVDELKAIAEVRGTTLIKAQTDPIFVAVKEKFEEDKKKSKASMGASRGSGGTKKKKDFKTPGLSRDEHKAMIQQNL